MLVSLGISAGVTILFLGFLLLFTPPKGTPSSEYSMMQYLAMVWKGHLEVNGMNTLFFFWAITILVIKYLKLRHQKEAMLLDVVPYKLGTEITAENVGAFIDHLYKLPAKLRDSMMVNRIRRPWSFLKSSRTPVTSCTLCRPSPTSTPAHHAELHRGEGLPLGHSHPRFIGTVLGLSHALLSLSFDNLEDVKAIIGVLKGVISGLGTAFDATLVGLVFAMLVNFPMNAMIKMEDDNLATSIRSATKCSFPSQRRCRRRRGRQRGDDEPPRPRRGECPERLPRRSQRPFRDDDDLRGESRAAGRRAPAASARSSPPRCSRCATSSPPPRPTP